MSNVLLAPARRFDPNNPELIDRPDVRLDDIGAELKTLETANRRLGGHQLVLEHVDRFIRRLNVRELRVLDLGTGIADIPRALVAWSRPRGLRMQVTAIDLNEKVLAFARQSCREWPEIELKRCDMLSLPFDRNSFDLVICSLALHHFERHDAVVLLRAIQEIARTGYIVNDLRRNWFSIALTEVLSRIVIKDPIVKHDARSSCRAAFTIKELRMLAQEAGLTKYQISRHHFGFRMVLEGRK